MIIHCVNNLNIHWQGFADSPVVAALPHRLLSDCPQGWEAIQNNPFMHHRSLLFFPHCCCNCCFSEVMFKFYDYLNRCQCLDFACFCCLQPCVELRLPSNPGGFACAPAAHRPSTGHRGLRLWTQSSPSPPDPSLCHPSTHAWHPTVWAQRQRALSHLQRLLAGESGGWCLQFIITRNR